MVVKTVSRSSVELTALPTSPSAFSSSTDRPSSAVRACSSLNSRVFSIAITAWSAKVWSMAICRSVNIAGSAPATLIAPIGLPSRSMGTATALWNPVV